jgi:hypothetical protein
MSKVIESEEDPLDREITNFEGAVRGKYAVHTDRESIVVIIDPDLTKVFPNQQAVNDALRFLLETGEYPALTNDRSAK